MQHTTSVDLLQMGVGVVSGMLYSWSTLSVTSQMQVTLSPAKFQYLMQNFGNCTLEFLKSAFLSEVCNFVYLLSVKCLGHRLVFRLRKLVFTAIITENPAFFDTRQSGELVNMLTEHSQRIAVLPQCVARGFQHVVFITRGLWSIYSMGSSVHSKGRMERLALELVVIIGGAVMIVLTARPHGKKQALKLQSLSNDAAAFADERFAAVRVVQAYTQERAEIASYSQRISALFWQYCVKSGMETLQTCATQCAGYLAAARILLVCGSMCAEGSLTVGGLIAFIARSVFILVGVRGLMDVNRKASEALIACDSLFMLTEGKSSNEGEVDCIIPEGTSFDGSIEVQDVVFSYPSRPAVTVLDGFSLTVPSGGKLAIVGQSGSGKTSLSLLLLKLYSFRSGRILVSRHDITKVSTQWLRRHVGYVAQEAILFDGSIAQNIVYGNPDVDYTHTSAAVDDVTNAAKKANAHEFIMALPEKYETRVGQRGVTLSGGQKQRIALARALYRQPQILILDEALNALDGENEAAVRAAIDELVRHEKKLTVIAIGHQLASVCNADLVVVLRDGRIAEEGSYEQLTRDKASYFSQLMGSK